MFTIEHSEDFSVVTSLDDRGSLSDVRLTLYDNVVYLSQWDEKLQKDNLIEMSAMQWLEMMKSMDQVEGAYYLDTIGD
tara:strand:- start:396 stop:629 length:234 start_codon:yes stop_codon:yes gene_type:complete